MDFSLSSIVTLAATTGIFTALLNEGAAWLRETRTLSQKRKANAGYLALRLAVLLETYANACSDVASDVSTYEASNGAAGNYHSKLPEILAYPADDESWKVISPDLLDRCLSFPNRVLASQQVIRSANDHAILDEDNLPEQCVHEAASRGLEAWQLATELRERYGFAPPSHVYDYGGYLREILGRSIQRRKAWEAQNAKNVEAMFTAINTESPGVSE